MSLSHFDEKSGVVACKTSWGQWWQTVSEVYIDIEVPEGTRGKDCKIIIKTGYIECQVNNELIFQGELYESVVVDDCTWTLEEQNKIAILLTKATKFTSNNLWESLLTNDYVPDPWTREEMLKKLDLEKFQIENGSGDEHSSVREKEKEDDEDSVGSRSDGEAAEFHDQIVEPSSFTPQSPSGSVEAERSEDEIHISDADVSNHGSDNEVNRNERGSEASDVGEMSETEDNKEEEEEEKGKKSDGAQGSDHEGSLPELNIESEDEKVGSDDEGAQNKIEEGNESDCERNSDEEDEGKASQHDEGDEAEIASGKRSPPPEHSDDEGNPVQESAEKPNKSSKKVESDAEASDNEKSGNPDYGDLIANIFGDSEDEDEFEGFGEDDVRAVRKKKEHIFKTTKPLSDSEDEKSEAGEEVARKEVEENEDEERDEQEHESEPEVNEDTAGETSDNVIKKTPQVVSDDDSDDGISKMREDFVSDFDLMIQKKKEESSKRRKRKDVDIINDSDDLIADIISQMRQAADEDRVLNKVKKTATKKLKILPLVMSQLKKQDLKMAFLDQGVLNVMADWLAPLPDRSLPNLQIREGMIKQLDEFPSIDQSLLKSSGVGRALMYLYKHPKETKENKERAGRLITEWARPIFNVTTDYHSLTKEEREQRDYDHIPKKRKLRDQVADPDDPSEKDIDKALSQNDKKLRPGDKGWVGRARVPAPSTKDYVFRPKWNVEMECGRGSSRKPMNRFEKHMRTIQEKKKMGKCQRAVTISIEGRKMAI